MLKMIFKVINPRHIFKGSIFTIGFFFVSMAMITPSVYADEKAIDLLNRMNQAVHKLNYSGTLAYLKGNTLSSLHIEHSVVNGVEIERVVRLNEEGDEVSRELKDFSFATVQNISPEMEKVYSFDLGRENRIANIPCRIITARPKDRERYLQKYCIDATTGMLLDYILVGKSHQPVEQFMFTSINIHPPEKQITFSNDKTCSGATCSDANANPARATALVNQTDVAKSKISIVNPRATKQSQKILSADLHDGWVMESLPLGYEIRLAPSMNTNMKTVQGGTKDLSKETTHYILTDGLSSLSLFVSPFTEEGDIGAVKINSGALNVVSQRKGNAIITVVGEVPENTLRKIFKNLKKK